jgi:hypothetical protein
MPIEGDLRSLNLTSVVQLISQDKLTGVLKIRKKNELVNLGFIEGMITGSFYERGESVERLEDYLVKSGVIKKNLFEMVKEMHQETRTPMMNILLNEKYLSIEKVERIIKFKIQEVLDEIFTWNEGQFKFEKGAIIYPKSIIKIRLPAENLILEAARRFDEWPRITKAIPAGDLVYKKIERPELKLKHPEDEEKILSLLDGHRSVDDLIEISGLGKFHTYSSLYHLLSTGQIEIAYAKPRPKKVRVRKHLSLKFLRLPLGIAIIAAIILIEILIGNHIAAHKILSFNIIDKNVYQEDYRNYQEIFFYKNNRIPSAVEVKDIFVK